MILKSQHEVPIFNVLIYFGDFHLGPLSLEDWETRPCSTRWLRFAISTYARDVFFLFFSKGGDSTKAQKKMPRMMMSFIGKTKFSVTLLPRRMIYNFFHWTSWYNLMGVLPLNFMVISMGCRQKKTEVSGVIRGFPTRNLRFFQEKIHLLWEGSRCWQTWSYQHLPTFTQIFLLAI